MYLKSIELNGFKSFAKKSELLFTSSISAIVGPNGSGKSNIAEAFRFVLGEQSIKSLRGKRGEDLVWNGSPETPRAGRASVKLIFDNKKKFLPLDFTDVSLERVVHRDGVNEYFLNGSQVRLKDIVEMLASANIGSSGHHIISQGEADRILNATLTERKSMIEDALGLRVYQYKKNESQKKLLKTKENIGQVESLRKEITPHLKFLKKQVEKMEKGQEIKNELVSLARTYLNIEKSYIESEKSKILEIKKPLTLELESIRSEVLKARNVLEKSENKDLESDEVVNMEKRLTASRENKERIAREISGIDGEISSALRMVKKQEELLKSNEWKTVELRAVRDLYKEIDIHISTIETSKDELKVKTAVSAIRSILLAFIDMHQDRVDNNLLMEATSEIENLNKKRAVLVLEKEKADMEEISSISEYQKLKKKVEEEKDISRDAEKNLFKNLADEQKILSKVKELEIKENALFSVDEEYKRDLLELGALLSTSILNFENDTLVEDQSREKQAERKRQMEKFKVRFEESGAIGGDEVLKEYKETKERDEFLEKELLDLDVSAKSLFDLISDLESKLDVEFKAGIEKINNKFKDFFILMFGGGDARLSVVFKEKKKTNDTDILLGNTEEEQDDEDSDKAGIDIVVSLPKKKTKGLIELSGGERALTSIALLFAISSVNPPPFIILDETDAALDEANSRKYGDMIENLSRFSQLIVITHNRETMSRASMIYGVTMGSGSVSKILSIAFDEAVAVAK